MESRPKTQKAMGKQAKNVRRHGRKMENPAKSPRPDGFSGLHGQWSLTLAQRHEHRALRAVEDLKITDRVAILWRAAANWLSAGFIMASFLAVSGLWPQPQAHTMGLAARSTPAFY